MHSIGSWGETALVRPWTANWNTVSVSPPRPADRRIVRSGHVKETASKADGEYTVYLTFESGQSAAFVNLDWFTFSVS